MGRMVIYLKLVLTAIFWGGNFVAARIVAQQVGPFSANFVRFFVASAFLLAFVWRRQGRIPLLGRGEYLLVALLGLTGVFGSNTLFFLGLKTVTASRASVIIATCPVFIVLLSSYFFKEGLNLSRVLGVFLSVMGVFFVISKGSPMEILLGSVGWGELSIMGVVFGWTLYSLIGKRAMRELSPLIAVTYAFVFGTAFLFAPAYLEGFVHDFGHCSPVVWLSILYIGLLGSALSFIWYYEGIQAVGPSRAGVFMNLVPLSAIVIAFLVLGERLDVSVGIGAALVISGVTLTTRPLKRD